MRHLVMIAVVGVLAACQMGGDSGKATPAPNALTGGEIEVTALDGGAKPVPPTKPVPRSKPVPGVEAAKPEIVKPVPVGPEAVEPVASKPDAPRSGPAAPAPDPAPPPKPKSAQQMACEKKGGNWGLAGKSGASTCITPTGEGTKQCRRQTDCTGSCLARSGTCAPYAPLFGCNEILQADGSRVTLCID
ncbi:MAG: hypothetical protein V4712_14785 [Pseudomonadota bacterium]